MSELLYPEAKKIKIADREFEVKKLPFKKLMKAFSYLKKIRLDKEGKIVFDAPEDFENNSDNLIDALAVILDVDKTWLENNLDLSDINPVMNAINEVIILPFGKAQQVAQK
ncbi:MAG: hypothetical protein HY761_10060 [Candidatus Omnitrophica bacterium]|nr:hypothetical protein [Candidatus Omnitrophota bacterium]